MRPIRKTFLEKIRELRSREFWHDAARGQVLGAVMTVLGITAIAFGKILSWREIANNRFAD